MAFLSLNGWTLPIQDGGKVNLRLGGGSRSPSGRLRSSQRDSVSDYTATTCHLTHEAADALEGLLGGRGHSFPFECGLSSATGLSPEPGYAGVSFSTDNDFDTIEGGLDVVSGTFSLRYNAQLTDNWTVQWREYNGTTWRIALLTSSGVSYLDGVSTAGVGSTATSVELVVLDGVARLSFSGVGTLTKLTDLVILPFAATAEIAEAFHASIYSFSPLPDLKLTGDMLGGRTYLAEARVSSSPFALACLATGCRTDSKQVAFQFSIYVELLEPSAAVSGDFNILQEAGDNVLAEDAAALVQEH